MSDRLSELGARRSIRHLGMDVVRVTGGQAVALVTVPVQLLRGPGGEERVLKNARDLCAATAVVDANYRALAQITRTCRDKITEKLAVDLQAESEEMLSECYASLDRLAEAVISEEVDGEPVYQIGRIGAVQMLRLPQLGESLHRLRDEAADVLRFARRGAVRQEAQSIIPDYDNLSVEQIRDRLARLSQSELSTVEAYEAATLDRVPVLEAIQELHGAEPWPGYDRMNVGEIRARLREVDEGQIRAVLDYERGHKDRASIPNAPEVQFVVAA
ncbi:hypothetical protein Drose_16175 [Dactylosporangium roseum]|uniref:Uncharacterized protein n=1 Tax=Dactylosporangium roseum TaxID=47989 RepID=A0ABY5ZD77_9ACTN|nr:hypothetical protein [Dactylosporangium roseum]UWZ39619.1 hypothetical protein Drose_16175 [Dactylosporangium roseum]